MDMNHMNHMMHMDHPKGFAFQNRNHLMFQGWDLNTHIGIASAMLLSVVLSIFLEVINHITKGVASRKPSSERLLSFKEKFILNTKLSVLQMTRVLMAYLLMLCVMTMNVWIYVSTIVGAGIGYYFSGVLFQRLPTTGSTEGQQTTADRRSLLEGKQEVQDVTETKDSDLEAASILLDDKKIEH